MAVKVTDWPKTEGFTDDVSVVVVADWPTTCVKTGDVLVVKLPSPLYTAVIECEATDRFDVVNVATPPASVPAPMRVAPLKNEAAPVAVPAPGATAAMVAVNVTDWPKTEGLADDVTVVVVAAWLTVCESNGEVLPLKFASPP